MDKNTKIALYVAIVSSIIAGMVVTSISLTPASAAVQYESTKTETEYGGTGLKLFRLTVEQSWYVNNNNEIYAESYDKAGTWAGWPWVITWTQHYVEYKNVDNSLWTIPTSTRFEFLIFHSCIKTFRAYVTNSGSCYWFTNTVWYP